MSALNLSFIREILFTKTAAFSSGLVLFWLMLNPVSLEGEAKRSVSERGDNIDRVEQLAPPILGKSDVDAFAKTYQKFEPKVIAKNKTNNKPVAKKRLGLTPEQERNQKGRLKTVFAGNVKMQLKAVIDIPLSNESYALVLEETLSTKKQSLKRYMNGDNLHGYRLEIDTQTQIHLVDDSMDGPRKITLIMYNNK